MPRTLAIPCSACGRRFSGDEALKRHRILDGSSTYRCLSDRELGARNYWRDEGGVYHRGASLLDALPPSTAPLRPEAFPGVADTAPHLLARATDPITSVLAARKIRTGTLKARLLEAYAAEPEGLTDEEAAARVGISVYSASKRCADLRRDGLIVPDGVRRGAANLERMVCRAVTEAASA